jgi:PII-like signaling protein
MKAREVTMVHIYLTEGDKLLNKLMQQLHDNEKVCGVTVFRGITGFGKQGHIHSSGLIDVSFDLPLVIEFFDSAEKVSKIIEDLKDLLEPGHIVSWPATIYE